MLIILYFLRNRRFHWDINQSSHTWMKKGEECLGNQSKLNKYGFLMVFGAISRLEKSELYFMEKKLNLRFSNILINFRR